MPPRYFHGGRQGLKVGDYVLPPSETKVPQNGVIESDVRRDDRVYVATDPTIAILWAAQFPAPMMYEVEPEGELKTRGTKKTG